METSLRDRLVRTRIYSTVGQTGGEGWGWGWTNGFDIVVQQNHCVERKLNQMLKRFDLALKKSLAPEHSV